MTLTNSRSRIVNSRHACALLGVTRQTEPQMQQYRLVDSEIGFRPFPHVKRNLLSLRLKVQLTLLRSKIFLFFLQNRLGTRNRKTARKLRPSIFALTRGCFFSCSITSQYCYIKTPNYSTIKALLMSIPTCIFKN